MNRTSRRARGCASLAALALAFVAYAAAADEAAPGGGRQVVCVDFKRADGTLYDVDFYVDRAKASGGLLVEDAVIHKMSAKNVLSDARRAELDRKK